MDDHEIRRRVDALAQPSKDHLGGVRELMAHNHAPPDALESWDHLAVGVRLIEDVLMKAGVTMVENHLTEAPTFMRDDVWAALISLIRERDFYQVALTIGTSPEPTRGIMALLLLRECQSYQKEMAHLAALAQMAVLYSQHLAQVRRISELEAQVAALQADLDDADPPCVDLSRA